MKIKKIKYRVIEYNQWWTIEFKIWLWPFWILYVPDGMPYLFDNAQAAKDYVDYLENELLSDD